MNIRFDLTASACNEFPFLTIKHNQIVLYDNYVEGESVLEFDLDLEDQNTITLAGIKKSNGENGKWDTEVDVNGLIVKDKKLIINNIRIDNVDMGSIWIRDLDMHSQDGRVEKCNWGMWNNGFIQFDFTTPILDWIIQEKFINKEKTSTFEFENRNGQGRFNYEFIQEKVDLIKKILHAQNPNL